jgi:hypothetical protein
LCETLKVHPPPSAQFFSMWMSLTTPKSLGDLDGRLLILRGNQLIADDLHRRPERI